jgi:hypothetical protein
VFAPVYESKLVHVKVVAQLLGDYNRNSTVYAADHVVWRKPPGQAVTPLSCADGDGDGTIDNDDYNVWRARFGQTAGSGAGASANAAVPEPATLAMLIVAAVGIRLRRRQIA